MTKKKNSLDAYYRSLKKIMVLIITLVSFAPMILLGGLILFQFHGSYHEKTHAHLAELVLKHKQNIDRFLMEKLGDIRVLGKTFNIQVAYAGPFKLGKALYSSAEWFHEAMQRDYFISDVFLGLRGLPHFIITVRDNWNGEPWILRATIDFAAFNNLVENIRIGETGFAFILNKKGEFQTKPRMDIGLSNGPYIDFLKSESKTDKGIRIANMTDDSGRENIYVAAFVKERDWLLVYQQRAADAFSDLNRAMELALIIFIISGVAIILVAALLSGRMVSRISRADK
ncbi:MAG: cache domain-containing protein, partial [Deltaproteobacteria bacterium]|nr:cache domain-containing protein [Deltaproteobacteria bacterium]